MPDYDDEDDIRSDADEARRRKKNQEELERQKQEAVEPRKVISDYFKSGYKKKPPQKY